MISRAQNYHRKLLKSANKFVRLCTSSAGLNAACDAASVACVLALAARGLSPPWLYQSAFFESFKLLVGDKPIILDTTDFADRLTGWAQGICKPEIFAALPIDELFAQFQKDPLFAGWVYQVILCRPRKSVLGIADHIDGQSAKAADVDVSDLPKLTQWFTPSWVSEFLIEETIGGESENEVFCDPACGAGHILVEALRKLFDNRIKTESPATALNEIFQRQLYGFDIDPFVLQLAGLSLYLAARDLETNPIELPVPKLFSIGGEAKNCDGIGSLWLGVDGKRVDAKAYGLNCVAKLSELPAQGEYTAIAANPPYLGHRLMPPSVRQFVKENYGESHYDLYTTFLELSLRLLGKNGKMALICQQSFLSTQRYESLRKHLEKESTCRSLVLLGSGVFDAKPGEKVSNAIYVAQKNGDESYESKVKCWRILDSELKDHAAESGIKSLPHTEVESKFGAAFWCPEDLRKLFADLPAMESADTGIVCTNGLFTCNNDLFVKLHYQVREEERPNYVAYDKGGGQKWYRKTPYVVQFTNNGEAIRNYRFERGQSKSLPGERFYFQPGITYSYIGTRGFKARLLSENSVFDIASSSIFSQRTDDPDFLFYLLGFLNSSLSRFLLGVLNPTVNFQIGDLRRLPFLNPPKEICSLVAQSAKQAVELARKLDTFDPLSPDYKVPALLRFSSLNGQFDLKQAYASYIEFLEDLNRKESNHQKLIDDQIFDLYEINSSVRKQVLDDFWVGAATKKNQLGAIPPLKQCVAELAKHLDKAEIDPNQHNVIRRGEACLARNQGWPQTR